MMKILFVLYSDYENHQSKGVSKKVSGMIKALKKIGHSVSLIYRHENNIVILSNNGDRLTEKIKKGITKYRYSMSNYLLKILKNSDYDLIIVRYPGSIDYCLYRLFKKGKKYVNKTILELPTYPIGYEMLNRYKSLFNTRSFHKVPYYTFAYSLHLILSRKLKKFVDKILSYFTYSKIWGIDVINIDNGIDLDDIKIKCAIKKDSNIIDLIMVATFDVWHGVDRIISGLANYYYTKKPNEIDVRITLVGKGEELDKLKTSKAYEIVKEYITITGPLFGDALDAEYNKADIAISTLALHRIGMNVGSTLKTKEYIAKGIPFVYAYKEKQLNDNFQYAMILPSDDSDIDIRKIINFYNSIKGKNYIEDMRKFAERYDWTIQMEELLKKLD